MKTSKHPVLFSGWILFLLLVAHVSAADNAAATITGRIQNEATGQYLSNARVGLKGTSQNVLTDEHGVYRLLDVPPGPVVLDVFFTGLDRREVAIEASPGQLTELDIALGSAERYGQRGETLKLDPFMVSAGSQLEGEALAVSEQRYSANMKDVVTADSLGDVTMEGVGNFLRYLPGLIPDGNGGNLGDVTGVSARGFPSSMTGVAVDGNSTVNLADGAGHSRTVNTLALPFNNIASIEVTKVPLPSTPADSMSGSINIVTRSSFDRKKAQLRYGINILGNSRDFSWSKSMNAQEYEDRKIKLGFDLDYTLPITKNLGIAISAMSTNRYSFFNPLTTTYNAGGTNTGASPARPYLQSITQNDLPRTIERRAASIKVDWRVTPNSVLTFGLNGNESILDNTNHAWTANAGTNGSPSVTGGVPFSYGEDYTIGATGRGSVTMSPTLQYREQPTVSGNINYRFDNGIWKIDGALTTTDSRATYRNFDRGRFSGAAINLLTPNRVVFEGSLPEFDNQPERIRVFNNAGQELNIFDISNWRLTTTRNNEFDKQNTMDTAKLNVRRRLGGLPVPASVQAGGLLSQQKLDQTWRDDNYTFNGGTNLAPYVMSRTWDSDVPGYRGFPYLSMNKLYAAWQQNPALFTQTAAQRVASEVQRITNSEAFEETISALYLQGEARLLKSRLLLLGGVRWEHTDAKGRGMLYDPAEAFQRDANGNFLRNSAGQRLRKPEAGAAGSMEELQITRFERAAHASRTLSGFYPSLHATYIIREDLQLRAGYAKTYGRPNFTNVIPRTVVTEADLTEEQLNAGVLPGTISVRNTALRPWTADNYDLRLEHYSKTGGLFTAGVFVKEIDDFFGNQDRIASEAELEALGLPQDYLGWQITTQFNAGTARVRGVELNVRQSLGFLGPWGRHFIVFANATKLKIEGPSQANFSGFVPENANWGFSFRAKRVGFGARWIYRGETPGAAVAALGPDAVQYTVANTRIDLDFSYELKQYLRLAVGLTNVNEVPIRVVRYGSQTPAYAKPGTYRDLGIPITVSIKGTF